MEMIIKSSVPPHISSKYPMGIQILMIELIPKVSVALPKDSKYPNR